MGRETLTHGDGEREEETNERIETPPEQPPAAGHSPLALRAATF